MPKNFWSLKHCSLFSQLDEQQLQRIESRSRSKSFPTNSAVFLPTEDVEHVFLLTEGLLKVSHVTSEGKESILTFIEAGELFGELALFDGQARDEIVSTMKRSNVVMIPIAQMRQLIHERSDVALGITKLVGLRRQRIERRLKNLLFLSNRDRLVHLLLELAGQFGFASDEGIGLRVKLSHQELANLIGSTRETVTIILGQLNAEGSVSCGRRKIVLVRPEFLARSVGCDPPRVERPSNHLTQPRLAMQGF